MQQGDTQVETITQTCHASTTHVRILTVSTVTFQGFVGEGKLHSAAEATTTPIQRAQSNA